MEFECSHDKETVLKGYQNAVKASGVALHSNSKWFYRKDNLAEFVKYEICTQYDDSTVCEEAVKAALQSVNVLARRIPHLPQA